MRFFIVEKRRDYYAYASLTALVRLKLTGTLPCASCLYSNPLSVALSPPQGTNKKPHTRWSFLLAPAAGLEPTTHSLGNCCSILMSYAGFMRLFYSRIIFYCKQDFVKTEFEFRTIFLLMQYQQLHLMHAYLHLCPNA